MGVRPRRWSSTRRRPFTAANGTRMYTYVVLSLRSDARSATALAGSFEAASDPVPGPDLDLVIHFDPHLAHLK